MPVQYTSILEEHQAVRSAAGLFDVSHMGEFLVTGVDAALFLDKLLVNAIHNTPIGTAVYSPMCASDGGVDYRPLVQPCCGMDGVGTGVYG